MKGLAYSSLRVGKRYWLVNFGEKYEFELIEIVHTNDFKLKDLFTLEIYTLKEITSLGRGPDFEIREM